MACTSGSVFVSPCTADDATSSYVSSRTVSSVFVFQNNSSSSRSAFFGCSVTGAVTSCSVSPKSFTIPAGDNVAVSVTYSTGRGGPSGGAVTVSGLGVTATLAVAVARPPVYVTPNVTTPANRSAHTAVVDTFTVQNNSASTATLGLTASCSSTISCAIVGATTVTVAGSGGTAQVPVSSTSGEVGTGGTVALRALASALPAPGNQDSGYVTVRVPYAPTVVTMPQNGEHRDPTFCVVNCFDITASYSTPAYVSLDAPRSLTLWYSSAQATALSTVQVDLADGSMPSPEKVSLRLTRASGTLVNFTNSGAQELFYTYPTSGAPYVRLAGQLDASSLATGSYAYTAELASYWTWAGSPVRKSTTAVVSTLVLNESASPFGAGWSIVGLQRLYLDSLPRLILASNGAGEIVTFTSSNTGATYASAVGDFSTLTKRTSSPDSALYDRGYPDGTTYSFLADGKLRYVKDRFGNRTSFGYGGTTLLRTITDPAGKTITLGYDANNKLSTITDPGGRQTRVTVDPVTNNLTQINDPTNTVVFAGAYDSRHRLVGRTDRAGQVWRYGYDFAGKVSADSSPLVSAGGSNAPIVTTYRSLDAATLVDTALVGGVHLGTALATPAPARLPDSVRAAVISTVGDSVRYAADRFGGSTVVEYPSLRKVVTITRNQHSQVTVAKTVAAGRVVEWSTASWDGPRLSSGQNVLAHTGTSYAYGGIYNDLTDAVGSTGENHRYLDATGTKIDSSRFGPCCTEAASRFYYDSRGRVIRSFDPRGDSTVVTYADTGYQNTLRVQSGTRVSNFGYDDYGRVAKGTNPRGDSVLTSYDSLNRVRQTVEPYAATTTFGFDAFVADTVTDPIGQQYRFDHNALGWLVTRTGANTADPLVNRQDQHFYTRLGKDSAWTNRRGQQTITNYDRQGRPNTVTLADGSVTKFSHDTLGFFAVDSNAAAVDTARTDSTGLVATETTLRHGQRYVVTATADASGSIRTLALRVGSGTASPSHSLTFGYDRMLRLDTIKVNAGAPTVLTYDVDGQVTQAVLPGGTTITYGYSSQHQPAEMHVLGVLDNTFGAYFTQDTLNRLKQLSTVAGDSTVNFAYDSLGRLATVKRYHTAGMTCTPDPHRMDGEYCTYSSPVLVSSSSFSYDKVGNPIGSGMTLDPGNRLRTYGGFAMTYDADGNMLTKNGTGWSQTFTWNSANQLTSTTVNGSTVRFWYDGQGRRVRKSMPSKTLDYLYFGNQLLAEVDSATGAIERAYSYYAGVDAPHAIVQGGGTYYYIRDAVGAGSVAGLVDGAGAVKNQYRYESFGGSTSKTENVPNPLQFAGREWDAETGLYYNRARYYDPQLGRFISEDPADLAGGINQFAYAANDPVNMTDPTGLFPDAFYECMRKAYSDGRSCGSSSSGSSSGSRGVSTLGFAGDATTGGYLGAGGMQGLGDMALATPPWLRRPIIIFCTFVHLCEIWPGGDPTKERHDPVPPAMEPTEPELVPLLPGKESVYVALPPPPPEPNPYARWDFWNAPVPLWFQHEFGPPTRPGNPGYMSPFAGPGMMIWAAP